MRKLVCLLLLAALPAAAGSIHTLEPSEIRVQSDDVFMVVRGYQLGTQARFDGPAGKFAVEASFGSGSLLHVWVPVEILNAVGVHTIQILGGPSGDSNVAYFRVVGDGPPPALPFRVHTTRSPINVVATNPDGEYVSWLTWTSGGSGLPNPTITCDPPSGSFFAYGTTTVQCTSTNSARETATATLQIVIYDATPPRLHLPDDIVIEANGPGGAMVDYYVRALDTIDGEVPVGCVPPPGSTFPIGITTVQCRAVDQSNNIGTGTFTVTVVEEEEPPFVIVLPDPITVEAGGPDGAIVTFTVTASRPATISCRPPSGSMFALGTTVVQCTATDGEGNTAAGVFDVIVVDSTPPLIGSVTATPDVLTPPNHKLVTVTIEASASDLVDPMPHCAIVDVTSNEPIDDDVDITSDLTVDLRAERTRAERWYDVYVRCSDASGNFADGSVTVTVPKGADQNNPAVVPRKKGFRRWW